MFSLADVSTTIIGFDSAWTDQPRAPGATCVIRCGPAGPVFVAPRPTSFAQTLAIFQEEATAADRCLVAIDQPTIVPNTAGSRPVDKVAGSLISWLGGGVQPANRSKLGMFDDLAPIWRFKDDLLAVEDPERARLAATGTYLMEVFPALALPSLSAEFCGRLKGAKYNPDRRKTFLAEHWTRVVDCAATAGDSLGIPGLGAWCRAHGLRATPRKADQDLLDAVLCAIIGYIWLFRDRSESLMIGDLDTGYMVAPAVGEARDRLLKAATERGVTAT